MDQSRKTPQAISSACRFIIGFLMFMVIPMALSLFYSFCKYDIQNAPEWIGLDNYIKILTDDSTFTKSLTVTCYYALIGTPLKVIFALIVALILNHESKVVPATHGLRIICRPLSAVPWL